MVRKVGKYSWFPLWLRFFLVAYILFTVVFWWFLASSVSLFSNDSNNEELDKSTHLKSKRNSARKSLIIVSHGRSGSSITGDLFNHHPDVFYMYEPLQTVERTQRKLSEDYENLAQRFLKNLLKCNFDEPVFLEDIEWYYRRPLHPRISRAIGSPPLCPYNISDKRWHYTQCPRMTKNSLANACKHHYQFTVVKILMSRVPFNSLESIFSVCNHKDIDCKIVFLVRDPRAVIPSSLSVNFYQEQGGDAKLGTRLFSYKVCHNNEENLQLIKNLPAWLHSRVKLLRYEDFASSPLKEMERLYRFAGLSVSKKVMAWLNMTTHSKIQRSDMKIAGSQAAFTVDDAQTAINRWRWKVHPRMISIIERYCKHSMELLGYKRLDNSYELQMSTSIPLYIQDYEAKKWFSQ